MHPPFSPLRYGSSSEPDWLTARVTFAAVTTNKLLRTVADFVPEADWATIGMVNGELMAKPLR
jgi:hypothetical protein